MKKCTVGTVALATAALFFASCSNDDSEKPDINSGEPQTISIRIAKPETSRAVTDPAIEANQMVTFTDGNLLLTKSNGEILYVYNFSSTASTDVNNSGSTIAISDAVVTNSSDPGVTIQNISGDVKMAYIVGNTSALPSAYASAAVKGGNISNVKAIQVTPAMEYDSTKGGLAKVSLYGEGEVVNNPVQPAPGTNNLYKLVEIDLYPHVARIEIGDITGSGDISQYHVNGIYINKYYPTMSLNFATPGTLVNQGQAGTTVYEAGQTVYTVGQSGEFLYDSDKATYFNNNLTALVKSADGTDKDKVWAYNVLAAPVVQSSDPMSGYLSTPTTRPAQIIVQVQDVKVTGDGDYSGMKYITVNRLYEQNTNKEIEYFKAGYIYQIEKGDFVFTKENLKEEANLEDIDLQVLVKPITWTVQKMTPELQ